MKTKKCELDDVDMMVCLSGVDGSYSAVKQNELYRITF